LRKRGPGEAESKKEKHEWSGMSITFPLAAASTLRGDKAGKIVAYDFADLSESDLVTRLKRAGLE